MKHHILLLFLLLMSSQLKAQKHIVLADMEFRIRNSSSEMLWFGLAEGDKIEFELSVYDSSSLRSFTFAEYEGGDIFKEINTSKIEKKTINIAHQGIYFFDLYQTGFLAGKRFGHIKVLRYPASNETKDFNTTVYWKTVPDTAWYTENDTVLDRIDTIATMIAMQHVDLGKKAKDNRAVIHFSIPDSTDCWGWFIAAGSEGDMIYNGMTENLSEANPVVRNHGLIGYIALGGKMGVVENPNTTWIKAGFTNSSKIADEFLWDGVVCDSLMNRISVDGNCVCSSKSNTYSLMLMNVSRKKTTAMIYIDAVRIKSIYAVRSIRKFEIVEKQVPYLKQ
jgi:hypothetical protein